MTLIVNGQRIEQSQIQQEFDRLKPHYENVFDDQPPQEQKAQLMEWSKENVIERVLLSQEAKRRNETIAPEQIDAEIESIKNHLGGQEQFDKQFSDEEKQKLRQGIILQKQTERLIENTCKDLPEPSGQQIQQFYETHKERFISPEQLRVCHIVKHLNFQTDEETAEKIMQQAKAELDSGAVFENVAEKYSDCPENGGDLGYITKGQMVEEFEDVVFNMNTGQISDVFHTRFGLHIAKLYDRKPSVCLPLEEAKDAIDKQLKEQSRTEAVNALADELKTKAAIEEI
jgi:parvulin-like peptidyl-prolyl isomerase